MNPYELLAQQDELDYGPERVALAEEAVRQADLLGDEEAGYDTRMVLIETVNLSGQAEKMFAPFAWCQDYATRHPDEVSDYTLAWYHKWLLGAAQQFPQIPLSRIYELHASYAQYARRLGAGASSIPYLDMSLALHMGDKARAQRSFTVWEFAKDDRLSDCPACEANTRAEYRLFLQDDAGCVREGQRILDKGLTCSHIPHLTYSVMVMPLYRLGEHEKAAQYAQKAREMIMGDPDFLASQAEQLEYLAHTDPAAGLAWHERHIRWADETREQHAKMDFYAASALLFQQLDNAERFDHYAGAAQQLARTFDERNGTDYYIKKQGKLLG